MKSIEQKLIRFRFRQLYRTLQHVGWGYVLLILPILFIGLLSVLAYMTKLENKYVLLLGYVLFPFLAHQKRTDLMFLQQVQVKQWLLFLLEYSLLCLPYTFILLFLKWLDLALYGHCLVVLFALLATFINTKTAFPASNWALSFIPNYLFEWKGSIRRYHVGLIALWLLACLMATHELAYFLFVFMFAGIIGGTFKPTEGKELKPTTTTTFYKKIIRNTLFLLLILLPHASLYLYYNGEFWFVLVGILIYFMLFQCYCIFYKYANYVQYRDVNNDLPVAIFIFLCPFLPFSLFLLYRTFRRAKVMVNQ